MNRQAPLSCIDVNVTSRTFDHRMAVTSLSDLYITFCEANPIYFGSNTSSRAGLPKRVMFSEQPFPCADAAIFDRGQKHNGDPPTFLDCPSFPFLETVPCSFGHAVSVP